MKYELLLKLKKAGFPLKKKRKIFAFGQETTNFTEIAECDTPELSKNIDYLIPTLEELIDACGDIKAWFGYNNNKYFICYNGVYYSYKTRKEVVANLWLELRKQKLV